jgi:hypothetical protein
MKSLRRIQSPDRRAGIDGTRSANVDRFRFTIVPAGGTSAAIGDNEKFGTFSFYGQRSDKVSSLPVRPTYSD